MDVRGAETGFSSRLVQGFLGHARLLVPWMNRQSDPKAKKRPNAAVPPLYGLARILSKWGICSRTVAETWIRSGRVRVDGRVEPDPDRRHPLQGIRVEVDGRVVGPVARRVLMLNKPRGYLVTRQDTGDRKTVYDLVPPEPWLFPVGRLDQASSGLLLLANDPLWAGRILGPGGQVSKTYHVQVSPPLLPEARSALAAGPALDGRCCLPMDIRELRCGGRTQWLEFVLREGRNRQIRRLVALQQSEVLRLVRVAIGPLLLGGLRPGEWRWLADAEVQGLECSRHDLLSGEKVG